MKTTYMPVANLIAAARVLAADPTDPVAQESLNTALNALDEVGKQQQGYAPQIAEARETYVTGSDNDLEIDDEPMLAVADDGVWVGAWVWVQLESEDADNKD